MEWGGLKHATSRHLSIFLFNNGKLGFILLFGFLCLIIFDIVLK